MNTMIEASIHSAPVLARGTGLRLADAAPPCGASSTGPVSSSDTSKPSRSAGA